MITICSDCEFKEVESNLHEACREGDLELIKIYLNKTFENDSKDLIFKIDETNQAVSLFKINNNNADEFIKPRTVKHELTEFFVTSIIGTRKNVKTLKFDENSEVKIIHKNSFYDSKIEEIIFQQVCISKGIFIPSNASNICEEAFYYCSSLTNSNLQTI